ncbi:sigma-54-dependent Fis family transcriptional regulator [Neobacillus niacini]|uniref:sigma-54-dependent Fis family transcriptional regulator n=1 Tax=Neobacillus niacini TaxID=86668 RepID=UPI0027D7DC30|nr:sigma-54-dependent Fis family transcriptional regulator [Neobacillus niacini]
MEPVKECLFPETSLIQTIKFMKKTKWNTVPVVNQSGKLIGVFTRSSLYNMLLLELDYSTPIENFIKNDIGTTNQHKELNNIEEGISKSEVGTGIIVDDDRKPVGILTPQTAAKNYIKNTRLLKEQLEIILNTSNLGAVMTDESGRIIFVNYVVTKMINQPAHTLISNNLQMIIPNLNLSGDEREATYQLKIRENTYIVRLSRYRKTRENHGYIALFQNTSEIENLAQELKIVNRLKRVLQTIIDHAYDGVVMINEEAKITFYSPQLIELFELENETINGNHVDEVLPQLHLSNVLKTGVADISELMEKKGIKYMIHRIPIYQDEQIIGVVGKIVYRQLHEVRERFRSYESSERGVKNNKTEESKFTFNEIITEDSQMKKLIKSGYKAGKGNTTILIRGESGTGKELFAHALHSSSFCGQGPFITVNCAAIPEHLLESEFFGYEGGAFSGANQKGKIGKFDLANGGTLFLDEIGDMSLPLQAKLLRVLQEREFYRVGGTERIGVNVRIIAATNKPLEDMVSAGTFREDLFYRLNVISVELPPLNRRRKDILLLSEFFIEKLNKQNGTSILGWEPLVEQVLLEYDWPGNIRELRNVWERAMIFAESGKVKLEDLPDYLLKKVGYDLGFEDSEDEMCDFSLMERAEQFAIQKALVQANGNKSKACKLLGISRSLLYDKLKKYEFEVCE